MSRVNHQRSTSTARPHSPLLKKPLAQAISTVWLASVMIGGACAAEGEVTAVEASQESGQSEQESSQLDAVVVTAQKRSQKLKDVPVPVTAVKGDAIRDKNIVLSTDIERLAPNLSAQGGGRTGKPRWFLRGIGTNDPNQNQEGPLGVYVDEVVVGLQKNQSFPLFDLERVEVLRGPQGTLWGKNNTGGTIHYISKKPTFNNDGYAKLTYGSYNNQIAEVAFGGALVEEKLAGRISIYSESYDGWAHNIVTDKDGPQLKDLNARLQLLANISDTTDAQLILSTRSVDTENTPSYPVGGRNAAGSAVTIPNPNGIITQGQTTAQANAGGGYVPPYGDNPDAYSDFWGGESTNEDSRHSATLKVNWRLGTVTLNSISNLSTGDGDSLSLVGAPANTTINQTSSKGSDEFKQISQEFRLSSAKDQALSWILGAYFYKLDASLETRSARFKTGTTQEQYSESSWDQTAESTALFANGKYKFNDQLALGLGLRFTREEKDITETSLTATDVAANPNVVNFVNQTDWYQAGGVTGSGIVAADKLSKSDTWDKVTWDITPEYRINKDILTYARIATGFRSGGFNSGITNAQLPSHYINQLDPETLTDYELGAKTTWLDGRLTFNSALFYYDIKNLQLNIQQSVTDATGKVTTSAAGQSNGNITGLEFEVEALPTINWHVGGTLGLLRSEYTDFDYSVGGVQLNASGNEFYRTPRTSLRLDTDYTIPFASGSVVLGTDWSYRSHIYHNATVQNDPLQETDGYWLGNARISYAPSSKKWQLAAFVNNVTDKNVPFLRQIVNSGTRTFPVSVGSPQTWGLQTTLKLY